VKKPHRHTHTEPTAVQEPLECHQLHMQ